MSHVGLPMNPRRVHDLMRSHFPAFNAADYEWTNIAESQGPNLPLLEAIITKYIASPQIPVEVHCKDAALLPLKEAVAYIASQVGQGNIRIADREFNAFVVVTANGVAAGWQLVANPFFQATTFGGG